MNVVLTKTQWRWYRIWQEVAAIIAALLFAGYFGVILSDRESPQIIHEARPLNRVGASGLPEVAAGTDLMIRYRGEMVRNYCETVTEIYRATSTGEVKVPSIALNIFRRPGDDATTVGVPIPSSQDPGPGILRVERTHYCNWLQRLFWPIRDEPLQIFFAVVRPTPNEDPDRPITPNLSRPSPPAPLPSSGMQP